MENKSCSLVDFLHVCAVMLGLHVDYIIRSHDQENDVAPHFSCLNLKNAVVPFLMSLASCDAYTSANYAPDFDYID